MTLKVLAARLAAGAALALSAGTPAWAEFHAHSAEDAAIELVLAGRHETGVFQQSAAEIVAFDAASQRAFVVNAASGEVDVLDLSDPTSPQRLSTISVAGLGAEVNSVAVHDGLVAVAVQPENATDNGRAAFYDVDGNFLSSVEVGALPDALTFSPDGRHVLVVNEGEPREDYAVDPEGSISIIDVSGGADSLVQDDVRTADFRAFNGREDELRAQGVRIFGPGASAAQDFEPEWVEVASDNVTAYASLQENNAIAVIDILSATVRHVWPLGFKDWREEGEWSGAGFDASREGAIDIRHWPVFGIHMPDTIRLFETGGETYIVTANEGDARAYDEDGWWLEEFKVSDLRLDPDAFPNAEELQDKGALGGLLVTSTLGVANDCNPSLTTAQAKEAGYDDIAGYVSAECVYDALYTFGGRSFSLFRVGEDGLEKVFGSGSDFEEITAELFPEHFNADHRHREVQLKRRSVNKGPEPEGVALGEIDGRTYAFIGLERVGGVMVYDITEPAEASFVTYVNSRDFTVGDDDAAQTRTDLGAEGLAFVPAGESPDAEGRPLLLVGNEVSGTTAVYAIDRLGR